jgi:hypothetical protein
MELLPVLVLDMIEILPPLEKYKYDTWRILLVKCYINNFVRLQGCIRNINRGREGRNLLLSPNLWEVVMMRIKTRKRGR